MHPLINLSEYWSNLVRCHTSTGIYDWLQKKILDVFIIVFNTGLEMSSLFLNKYLLVQLMIIEQCDSRTFCKK